MRYVIAGTAGHIDHGKSALVKALTGTDPDRLKEEKLRGITIDLGFAHLKMGELQIGFVDVPGHEKFVKNMLAGVGGIDFVLLVVAADESIMPQTREHFDICRLLGIQAGIIVITKKDLVEPDLVEVVREEVRDMVRGSFLEGAPAVAVSSKTGDGMEELRHALHDLATAVPYRSLDRKFRLPIDRVFSVRGFGTVVTGTLTSGKLLKDSEVELIPASITARVRGIQVYGQASEVAVAGQRTAVNLQGVDLEQIERGMVLTDPRMFAATRIVDVKLNLLPGARPLKNLLKVRFHQGTSEILARVALLGRETLEPGASAYAQLRLEAPAFCLHGDAFIIRQFSPAVTVGGGKILNPQPVKHKSTDRTAIAFLETVDRGAPAEVLQVMLTMQTRRAVNSRELNSLFGMPEAELKSLCASLSEAKKVILVPAAVPVLLLPEIAKSLEKETLALVAEFHEQNPLQKGLSREELRERVYGDLPLEVFRFMLDQLAQKKKISLQEEVVSIFGREVQLSAQEETTRGKIEAVFRQAGLQPPMISELAAAVGEDAEKVRRIYFWMLKQKILIKVSEELTWHRLALEEIKNKIRSTFKAGDAFGVADFKELFGMTRKHAIPLLEYLDRERITRRQGNDRILL
jgi:selenocysteine-specific elongation factor